MIFLIGISVLLVVYFGGNLVIDGVISTGVIAEFIIYVNMLTWPIASIGWVTSIIQRAAASQVRINAFLKSVPGNHQPHRHPTGYQRRRGPLTTFHFTYADSGIQALKKHFLPH